MSFEALLWIVPVAVLAVGVWRPRYGLVVLAAGLPLFGSPPGGPYLGALDAAALAAILTSLRAIRKPYPGEPDWRHSGMEWPIAAWVTVGAVSMVPLVYHPPGGSLFGLLEALPGTETAFPLYTWRALANLLLGFGLYFAVRRAFAGRPLRPLVLGLGSGVALVVVAGLAEFAGLVSLASYRAIGEPLYDQRLHSLFFHSAWLAEYLIIAVPFVVAGLATASRSLRLASVALAVLASLTVVLTQQRAAWLVLCAQLVAIPFLLRGRDRASTVRWIALALVVVLVAGAATVSYLRPDVVAPFTERLTRLTTDLSGRPVLWGAAAELTRMRPLLGCGLGSFSLAYDELHPPGTRQAWRFRGTAHSLYFHVLAERGILGLVALLAVGWAAASGLSSVSGRSDPRQARPAAGLLFALVGAAVYGLVQYIFYLKNIEFLVWILLGAGSLLMAGSPPRPSRRVAQAILVVAVVLLPMRWSVDPITSHHDGMYGLHEIERKPGRRLRWTEGRAAVEVEWEGETLYLDIIDGHPKAGARQVEVALTVDGSEMWKGEAPVRWETVALEVGPPSAETLTLGLSVEPTFRPFSDYRSYPDLPPSRDIRELGVAISGPYWDER